MNNFKYLSKYVFIHCVVNRAKEIELSNPKIDENCKYTDPIQIAIWELKNRKFPHLIKLFINVEKNEFVLIDPKDCILPDF